MNKKKKSTTGSSFDDFLREEEILEEVKAAAIKRVIAMRIQERMSEQHISKSKLARAMKTKRPAVDRLLDPEYKSVTLKTLEKAATALNMELRVELV